MWHWTNGTLSLCRSWQRLGQRPVSRGWPERFLRLHTLLWQRGRGGSPRPRGMLGKPGVQCDQETSTTWYRSSSEARPNLCLSFIYFDFPKKLISIDLWKIQSLEILPSWSTVYTQDLLHVCPGRGIPLLLRCPLFYRTGRRVLYDVQTAWQHVANLWFGILAYINKADFTWLV